MLEMKGCVVWSLRGSKPFESKFEELFRPIRPACFLQRLPTDSQSREQLEGSPSLRIAADSASSDKTVGRCKTSRSRSIQPS